MSRRRSRLSHSNNQSPILPRWLPTMGFEMRHRCLATINVPMINVFLISKERDETAKNRYLCHPVRKPQWFGYVNRTVRYNLTEVCNWLTLSLEICDNKNMGKNKKPENKKEATNTKLKGYGWHSFLMGTVMYLWLWGMNFRLSSYLHSPACTAE